MNTPKTDLPMGLPSVGLPRRGGWRRLVVGCLAAAGVTLALGAMSPAMADDDWNNNHGYWKKHGNWHQDNGWHNGHHKHKKHRKHYNGYYQGGYGYYYAQPRVYYAPPPVYYQPPPVYYYPQYRRPSVSIVVPFNFD